MKRFYKVKYYEQWLPESCEDTLESKTPFGREAIQGSAKMDPLGWEFFLQVVVLVRDTSLS